MREVARAALLALNFVLLASPAYFGSGAPAYLVATILVVLVNGALIFVWPRQSVLSDGLSASGKPQLAIGPRRSAAENSGSAVARGTKVATLACVAAIACALVFIAGRVWLQQILIYPHDSERADMLIVIQQGIRRVLQGRDPYAIYQVPWPATLPYGPVLWAPFMAPYLLHADVRFVTILGALFVPAACVMAAVSDAAAGGRSAVLGWLIVLTAIATSPDLRGFMSIGHTPAYWPLLAAFAWTVGRERWTAAAVTAGLLVVARTTMVSMVPVFVMAVWRGDRRHAVPILALMTIVAIGAYAPFALWDWRALKYALYGSYESLMKGFVWTATDWVQHTIGVTGLLLRHGWQRFVEIVQGTVLIVVYAMSWRALARGHQPLPWMAAALLAFSMTTLWPVAYIYLDVFLLLVCAGLADSIGLRSWSIGRMWTASLAVAGVVLGLITWLDVPVDPVIDVGTSSGREALYSGFTGDEGGPDRTFAWVDGTHAEVLVARRSRRDADLVIVCQPNMAGAVTQEMSVVLNGVLLGLVTLRDGWQNVAMPAPARAWQFGVNRLTLSFSSAVSPREAGLSNDPRRLSVAFDRLSVRTR